MKILITGGCGFIGSSLAIFLKEKIKTAQITSIDNLSRKGSILNKDRIKEKFASFKFEHSKNIVFTCGSGVTASVLALAYSLINVKYMPTIYDGSWSEYGKY